MERPNELVPKTLTVRELIDLLSQQNPDNRVYADQCQDLLIVDVGYEAKDPRVFLTVLYPNLSYDYKEDDNG